MGNVSHTIHIFRPSPASEGEINGEKKIKREKEKDATSLSDSSSFSDLSSFPDGTFQVRIVHEKRESSHWGEVKWHLTCDLLFPLQGDMLPPLLPDANIEMTNIRFGIRYANFSVEFDSLSTFGAYSKQSSKSSVISHVRDAITPFFSKVLADVHEDCLEYVNKGLSMLEYEAFFH